MSVLAERLLAIDRALDEAGVAHAFGGAIALAYCTEEPRGTRDLDVNVFVPPARAGAVLAALPTGVSVADADVAAVRRDGQVRLWWEDTPVDVFFNVDAFHDDVAADVRTVPFAGRDVPVLGCSSLAVFKVLCNRTKDWADLEAMLDVDALDRTVVVGWVSRLLGVDDHRTRRLLTLVE